MISLKYFILLSIIVFLTILVPLGCGSQGTTTKFKFTPIGSMEDSVTTPERLTRELDELLQSEDTKRMNMLQEKAEGKKGKDSKSTEKKVEETKGVETKTKP